MKTMFRNLALCAPVALLAVACGGGSSDTSHGTLGVYLTDAPACGFNEVNVTISKVRVHAAENAGENASGWHEIVLEPARQFDLLKLTNGVLAELGEVELPAGRYTQMRLVLAPNTGAAPLANSVVPVGGSPVALATPSAIQTGIKLVGGFDIAGGDRTELALDFDACKSVVTRGHGGHLLKPVISIVPMASSGAISGVLDPSITAADNPMVSAQVDGVIVKSTVPDTTGAFSLAPLPAGNYTVVVTADARASDVITSVPVTVSKDTPLSTAAAPLTLQPSATATVSGKLTPADAQALVSATQSFAAGPRVTIKYRNADVVTGDYSMTLPTAAPRLGQFGALPLTLTAQPAIAGKYSVEASAAGYQPRTQAADVSTGDVSTDFSLAP
ncbi:MAG TPA: DUF4382 domain-containing protein [Noviherbaspirillum sp.]|nr:DUF4382 domain-containing protein [Noviherbaspirillum sp.]